LVLDSDRPAKAILDEWGSGERGISGWVRLRREAPA